MAKKGEVADIVSQAQYDYFLKQAQSTIPRKDKNGNVVKSKDGSVVMKTKPLDSRGQAHNAKRDEKGKIISPGGGKADSTPSAVQAQKALKKFHNSGKTRDALPKTSNTKDAYTARQEHNIMKNDQIIRKATRPRGSSTYERENLKSKGAKAKKGKFNRNDDGGWEYSSPSQRSESKIIYNDECFMVEEFSKRLNAALRGI